MKGWEVVLEDEKLSQLAKNYIEKHHYSGTAKSQKPVFTYRLLNSKGQIKGIAVVGQPCGSRVEEAYSEFGGKVLELRRMVILPPKPKNTGSYFLSKIIKHLRTTEYGVLVSYADPNYGHTGGLYRAANFVFMGEERASNPRKLLYMGKKYSEREVYQKRDGKYIKKAKVLQMAYRQGKARYVDKEKKLVYLYPFGKVS